MSEDTKTSTPRHQMVGSEKAFPGATGIGASYIRDINAWRLYTMPGAKAFGSVDGFNPDRLNWIIAALRAALEAEPEHPSSQMVGYQGRVAAAHYALFHDDPTDVEERRARFFEEAGETAQAFGMSEDEAIELVRYTWSRPTGSPEKEVGAAFVTLTSLCVVAGINASECAEADLQKMQRPETIARIRAKRATRHGRGPLPGFDPSASAEVER